MWFVCPRDLLTLSLLLGFFCRLYTTHPWMRGYPVGLSFVDGHRLCHMNLLLLSWVGGHGLSGEVSACRSGPCACASLAPTEAQGGQGCPGPQGKQGQGWRGGRRRQARRQWGRRFGAADASAGRVERVRHGFPLWPWGTSLCRVAIGCIRPHHIYFLYGQLCSTDLDRIPNSFFARAQGVKKVQWQAWGRGPREWVEIHRCQSCVRVLQARCDPALSPLFAGLCALRAWPIPGACSWVLQCTSRRCIRPVHPSWRIEAALTRNK